MHTFKDH